MCCFLRQFNFYSEQDVSFRKFLEMKIQNGRQIFSCAVCFYMVRKNNNPPRFDMHICLFSLHEYNALCISYPYLIV